MAIEIVVPRLGWSMDEGTLTQWLKRDGDYVRKGDMLFVLEGDKASQEVESFDEGILRILPDAPQPGEPVRVGQRLGYLLTEGESLPAELPGARIVTDRIVTSHSISSIVQGTSERPAMTAQPIEPAAVSQNTDRLRASPRARRRALELGLDWKALAGTGSGNGGRIRERDVVARYKLEEDRLATTKNSSFHENTVSQPRSAARRTIAERMVASQQSTAAVTLTTTADVTKLLLARQRWASTTGNQDAFPTITDFMVKVTADVLRTHPLLNSRWEDGAVVTESEIHIGIAVDVESGLRVPVVRNADQLTLRSIAEQSRVLIAKARTEQLTAQEMQGGTFTISNLGSYGIDAFTPIIQLPQCAVLGIGRIKKVPVFTGEQFQPSDIVTLSLTFDHRIVDGAPAARFLQSLVRAIENLDL